MTDNKNNSNNESESKIFYSERVRAGKRTYFFDIKSTKSGDMYITITESKKEIGEDQEEFFKKRTIFLYKEDMSKFREAILNTTANLEKLLPNYDFTAVRDNDSNE